MGRSRFRTGHSACGQLDRVQLGSTGLISVRGSVPRLSFRASCCWIAAAKRSAANASNAGL
jgi:hypothetical protein